MKKRVYLYLLSLVLVLAFFLRIMGLQQVDLLFDEYADFSLAIRLNEHLNPFDSNYKYDEVDFDQTRFSHYLTAFLLFWKFDTMGSRMLSVVFGVLTILLVYLFGKELFSRRAGFISAVLTAFSIFHISFSRLAMTSGDSIFLFFYLTSAYMFYKGLKYEKNSYIFLAAIFTGIAIATKLFGLFLLPVFLLMVWFYRDKANFKIIDKRLRKATLLSAVPIIIYLTIFFMPPELSLIKLYLYFIAVVFIIYYTIKILSAKSKFMNFLSSLNFFLLSILYTFTFTPIHLSVKNFLGIFQWFARWNLSPLANAPYYETLTVLFVKLGIPFSIIFAASFVYFIRKIKSASHLYLILLFSIPALILMLMKWKLAWHLMVIFPIIYLILGKSIEEYFYTIRKKKMVPVLSMILLLLFLFIPFYTTNKIYPYYELDGYQYGEEFVGYNKPSFLTFEGVRSANNYIENQIAQNASVAIYTFDINSSLYNYSYVNFMYYPKSNISRYAPVSSKEYIKKKSYDYILLHFYTKDSIKLPAECVLNWTFSIDTIEVFYLYKCN